ncbi:MAG: XRE family transcriptional regulator [Oscillospiraceae bacterium]|nr:XRE family transcriptional regulator [Oscillospiraceae bacterium]
MEPRIIQIAERIHSLRDIMGFSIAEMAEAVGVSVEEYESAERGETDFSFTFIYKCADKFGVDMVEILTGENPHLSFYTIVRSGKGLPMKRRSGFNYFHLGAMLKNKRCEPFLVTAPYSEAEQGGPIHLNTHEGQEFDYIVKGSLKVELDGHTEILNAGDSVLYDSSHPHGMIATGGADCEFLAIILK